MTEWDYANVWAQVTRRLNKPWHNLTAWQRWAARRAIRAHWAEPTLDRPLRKMISICRKAMIDPKLKHARCPRCTRLFSYCGAIEPALCEPCGATPQHVLDDEARGRRVNLKRPLSASSDNSHGNTWNVRREVKGD